MCFPNPPEGVFPLALTGLEALDALAGGLADDRVYLLHGPNGGGKTTLALQFLYNGLLAGEETAIGGTVGP